jgi:hypothetical protein
MQKHLPIYVYGFITVLVGIFLIIPNNHLFLTVKHTLGISLILGAIFAFISAFARQRKHVQFAYHEMHALVMLTYGLSIVLFCTSSKELISFTVFLFVFYAFSEIIFSSWIFNLHRKAVIQIAVIRALLGLAIGFGTIIALNYTAFTLQIFGALFIMVGINIMLYIPVMKAQPQDKIQSQ